MAWNANFAGSGAAVGILGPPAPTDGGRTDAGPRPQEGCRTVACRPGAAPVYAASEQSSMVEPFPCAAP